MYPMTVRLGQWRAIMGVLNGRNLVMSKNWENYLVNHFISLIESLLLLYNYFESACIVLCALLYLFVLLQCHGDIELNPGPKNLINKLPSVFHLNLNIYQLITTQNLHSSKRIFHFICLSEIKFSSCRSSW